jgi:serine kinase of HPr protein (carbohydrate metabolism regulator)
MTGSGPVCIHATCLRLASGQRSLGVLLRGPSGSGKSMLALRLLDDRGTGLAAIGVPEVTASLVSDDQVRVRSIDGALLASAPAAISGLLEVRGLGIVKVPCVTAETPLGLVIEHQASAGLDRLPAGARTGLFGLDLPMYLLDFASPDAPARVRLLARLVWGDVQLAADCLPQDLAARR